jgi:membrane protein implicated in regulation of membrane protease activity
MPGAGYFGRMAGAALLGLVTLVAAFVIFTFLLPYLIPLALGTLFLVLVFLAIWGITYAAVFVGVFIYYLFRPMKVSREDKGYSIEKAKESGKREKGKS